MKTLSYNKNVIVAVLFSIAAATLVSCNKIIAIPNNPPTAISQPEVFTDSTTAMTAVAGAYTYNSTGQGFGYGDGNLTVCTGLSADELSNTTSSDRVQFYSYTLTSLNSYVGSLWSKPYQAIYPVNDILSGINNNSKLSASFVKQITGEMKVLRALYYFNLVNLYGNVPLITSTDYNANAYIPRTVASAIYTQIKSDLSDARSKLKAAYPSAGRARPNLYTALTLLAKVNLYQNDWQDAYNEADSVIQYGGYSLVKTGLNNVFLDGSTEAIWQLPAKGAYNETTEALLFIPTFGAPNYLLTPILLGQFETGDLRRQNWVGTTVASGKSVYYPLKYKNIYATAATVEDYMIFRLAEVLLIHAEAAVHLNNLPQALADVNLIRQRAGLPNSTADVTSPTAVLAAVMKERQTELFCEWGNRWFDLKRTGMASTVLNSEKTGWQDNAALYPIPQSQRLLDNLLTQNPGYN